MQMRQFVFVLAFGLPLVLSGRMARCTNQADQDFFGAIALTDDDAVAEKLGLSKETRANLASLIEKRLNDPDFSELAIATKNLPAEERAARLKSFREESEKQGMKLLTAEQQKKLQQIRLEKTGLLALGDPEVAKQLELKDDQKADVAKLISEREKQLAIATASNKNTVLSYYAGKLAQVLTDEQRAKWEQMGGQIPNTESSKTAEAPAEPPSGGSSSQRSRDFGNGRNSFSRGNIGGGFGGRGTSSVSASELTAVGNDKMQFKFKNARWPDVIQLFAERAGYSLVMESPPGGVFNYEDSTPKTPKQGLDVLNNLLLRQDMLLVPNEKLLLLQDLKNPIPPGLAGDFSGRSRSQEPKRAWQVRSRIGDVSHQQT